MGFLDILSKKGFIESEKIPFIEKELMSSEEKTADDILLAMGVSSDDILKAKEEYFNLPSKKLAGESISHNVLEKVPEKSAVYYKFVPIGIDIDGFLEIGIIDPDNIEARDALQFISSKNNLPFKLFLISLSDFNKVLEDYKGLSGEVTKALTELESEIANAGPEEKEEISTDKRRKLEAKIIEEAPVTKIVATILRYAAEGRASDVHIEHIGDKIRVRFRVDGVLHTSLVLPVNVHDAVVARIKILSNMKLDEKRKPQDGRFSARIEGRKVDFRVSTFPAYYGEKVVMRILESEKGVKNLLEAGLSDKDLETIRRAIKKPFGMILISGPTGSGKSTTLYSLLSEVDRESKNVLSLEDPVEFSIDGVSQSQVRPEIGYTFANGLRTALRQDPDVIMVGEIRDKETAALAVQAALTGHLVLSTIHTNNAVGIIPRLIEMDVDQYLIAPTLILLVAQRLAKTLCPDSGEEVPIEGSIKSIIDKEFENLPESVRSKIVIPKNVYKAIPSATCPTGTKGRIGVFEVIEMNKEIEMAILEDPSGVNIEKIVRNQGVLTMKEDAILKAFDKKIPFEEVVKL
ncbi:GspE/PulE family protein [Patescibacteria group bacterium]|nr:GspE/PulE family protein [Patescibacteria group bacterium]MCG2694606.1 GspE/PulE family protein [Candidatus Parcubacteria bacterium]